jgi:hypothetical protein
MSVDMLPALAPIVVSGGLYLMVRRYRLERARNAQRRAEIAAQVRLAAPLDRVSKLGTGGFGGTRGYWIPLRGPKRLVVGSDSFTVSAPQALREFVFTGRDSAIKVGRMRYRLAECDWIIITGQAGGREVQLAITKKDGVSDIWQALAGAGVALGSGP